MKETTKQVLLDKYANSPKGWCKWIKSKANSDLLDELRNEVKYDISLKERMYWLINDMHNFNKCPICGKGITLIRVKESNWQNNKEIIKQYLKETILGNV